MTIPTTLRSLADARNFSIGACVDMAPLRSEPQYREVLVREFNTCVAENIFKPHYIWTGPETYDFSQTDELAQFAADNNMTLRGHTLVWHQAVPTWLKEGNHSAGEVRNLLQNYIQTIVSRYKGVIPVWDVVNEAISDSDDSAFRQGSFWLEQLGESFIADAFNWAHQADPNCLLYYNDYEAESMNPKSHRVFALVSGLKSSGVPIHGVGLQGHMINGWRLTEDNRANVRRIAALGLDWQYTEVDIRMVLDGSAPIDEQLQVQAAGYRDLIELCMTEPRCAGLLTWGFTDKYSWIPGFRKGQGASLLLDENYQPKPSYDAVADELAKPR